MDVQFAHFRQQTATGQFIDFAIFDAKTESGAESDNLELLNNLTLEAIEVKKLKIDQRLEDKNAKDIAKAKADLSP